MGFSFFENAQQERSINRMKATIQHEADSGRVNAMETLRRADRISTREWIDENKAFRHHEWSRCVILTPEPEER